MSPASRTQSSPARCRTASPSAWRCSSCCSEDPVTDRLLIRGGTVVDATGERRADVLVEDGVITAVGDVDVSGGRVVDADGCIVAPGLVDLHTHLREPGREE